MQKENIYNFVHQKVHTDNKTGQKRSVKSQ